MPEGSDKLPHGLIRCRLIECRLGWCVRSLHDQVSLSVRAKFVRCHDYLTSLYKPKQYVPLCHIPFAQTTAVLGSLIPVKPLAGALLVHKSQGKQEEAPPQGVWKSFFKRRNGEDVSDQVEKILLQISFDLAFIAL
jgi:hypothetical protein